jgi:hypothetical protein
MNLSELAQYIRDEEKSEQVLHFTDVCVILSPE